jgi:hypothetical protein
MEGRGLGIGDWVLEMGGLGTNIMAEFPVSVKHRKDTDRIVLCLILDYTLVLIDLVLHRVFPTNRHARAPQLPTLAHQALCDVQV